MPDLCVYGGAQFPLSLRATCAGRGHGRPSTARNGPQHPTPCPAPRPRACSHQPQREGREAHGQDSRDGAAQAAYVGPGCLEAVRHTADED